VRHNVSSPQKESKEDEATRRKRLRRRRERWESTPSDEKWKHSDLGRLACFGYFGSRFSAFSQQPSLSGRGTTCFIEFGAPESPSRLKERQNERAASARGVAVYYWLRRRMDIPVDRHLFARHGRSLDKSGL